MHCAVCLLAMSHSDRQCRCNLRVGGKPRDRERTINFDESQKTSTKTRTYPYLVLRIMYLVLLYARKKAQRSMKQHRTAGQGAARHSMAPHDAELL